MGRDREWKHLLLNTDFINSESLLQTELICNQNWADHTTQGYISATESEE